MRKFENKIKIEGLAAISSGSEAIKVEGFDAQGNPVQGLTVVPGSTAKAEVNLEGDWTSVVGLPVFLLGELMKKTGVNFNVAP